MKLKVIDGSQGEGGGQILRSALSLSLITGQAFRLVNLRAGRARPGLMRQHLACVEAAREIGRGSAEGAFLGSTELTFHPGAITPGHYEFRIGSSGSSMLLLQTILPPLLRATSPSTVVVEGGSHNPFAPPFPFIEQAFLPLLRRMGFAVTATLERAGFHPHGGGRCRIDLQPPTVLHPLHLPSVPGDAPAHVSVEVCLAGLPRSIAEREWATLRQRFGLTEAQGRITECPEALGSGNTVHVSVAREGYADVFTGFGAPRTPAERVAREAGDAADAFIRSGAAVGTHLADQLLLPLALARGGTYTTTPPDGHAPTNAAILREFLQIPITIEPVSAGLWQITVKETTNV